jgi:hypothetical protein
MSPSPTTPSVPDVLIEAEDFDDHGGWIVDSQFEQQMGSPYLLAHGLGRPVADARTVVRVAATGTYEVWVRTKDWAPSGHPGRFTLSVDGTVLGVELGASGQDWGWEHAGTVDLLAGDVPFVLHDLTGFDGRCDAIFLSAAGAVPPNEVDEEHRRWRRQLRGLPAIPADAGDFDVVVVGGGVSGCAAALTSARLGDRVALIQDRPVLGGNTSKEIGIPPRGVNGALVMELTARHPDGDIMAADLLAAEPTAEVFLEHRLVAVETDGDTIVSIDVRSARGGHELRFRAPFFIDATGTAMIGHLAGADTMFGREAHDDYGESYAPQVGDDMHHGNTLFFRTHMADHPVPFPDVPWAVEVAKDYANLSGQLQRPGLENGPGPSVEPNPDTTTFEFNDGDTDEDDEVSPLMKTFPATHFWEYGQWLDPYTEGERIRDHLLRALYGTFSNVKRLDPVTYANLEFDWVAYVAAQGEFARYRGDYVLTETDITEHREFPDVIVRNGGCFCLHHAHRPGEGKYDFRLKDWTYDFRDQQPYIIPFRCLYSRNISNLMMAGKHISVTHVAGSATKYMGNGGQHGIAVAAAAHLCLEHGTTPRGLYEEHLEELQALTETLTTCDHENVAFP